MNGNAKPGMEVSFKPLDTESEYKDAVVSLTSRCIFKLDDIVSAIKKAFQNAGFNQLVNQLKTQGQLSGNWDTWAVEGEVCELLNPGAKGWRKGKMRIRFVLEFCPDEPDIEETPVSNQLGVSKSESTLDDIRRAMHS